MRIMRLRRRILLGLSLQTSADNANSQQKKDRKTNQCLTQTHVIRLSNAGATLQSCAANLLIRCIEE